MKLKLFNYTITIEKTKKSSGFSRRKWSEVETNTLLRLRNEGKSWEEVARLMNRTQAAVHSRYNKVHKPITKKETA